MTLRTIDSKEVSKICLGTMTWGQQNTEAEAHEQISYALDRGINMLDAAEMYPVPPRAETQGRTEEYIGTWFKKQACATSMCWPPKRQALTQSSII